MDGEDIEKEGSSGEDERIERQFSLPLVLRT